MLQHKTKKPQHLNPTFLPLPEIKTKLQINIICGFTAAWLCLWKFFEKHVCFYNFYEWFLLLLQKGATISVLLLLLTHLAFNPCMTACCLLIKDANAFCCSKLLHTFGSLQSWWIEVLLLFNIILCLILIKTFSKCFTH